MIYEFPFQIILVAPSAKLIVMAPTTNIRIIPTRFIYNKEKNK